MTRFSRLIVIAVLILFVVRFTRMRSHNLTGNHPQDSIGGVLGWMTDNEESTPVALGGDTDMPSINFQDLVADVAALDEAVKVDTKGGFITLRPNESTDFTGSIAKGGEFVSVPARATVGDLILTEVSVYDQVVGGGLIANAAEDQVQTILTMSVYTPTAKTRIGMVADDGTVHPVPLIVRNDHVGLHVQKFRTDVEVAKDFVGFLQTTYGWKDLGLDWTSDKQKKRWQIGHPATGVPAQQLRERITKSQVRLDAIEIGPNYVADDVNPTNIRGFKDLLHALVENKKANVEMQADPDDRVKAQKDYLIESLTGRRRAFNDDGTPRFVTQYAGTDRERQVQQMYTERCDCRSVTIGEKTWNFFGADA